MGHFSHRRMPEALVLQTFLPCPSCFPRHPHLHPTLSLTFCPILPSWDKTCAVSLNEAEVAGRALAGTALIENYMELGAAAWGKRGAGSTCFCSSSRALLGVLSLSCSELGVRRGVGGSHGQPALLTATPGLVLQPCQPCPILIETGSGSGPLGAAEQLSPGLGLQKLSFASLPRLSAETGKGEKTVEYFFWLVLPLCVCLSCLSLSGFKSHFMGFCSFGTSSSFQICPGTFRLCRDAKDTVSGLS